MHRRRAPFGAPAPRPGAGFSLIELLVVIAVIATLAAIVLPVFAQTREKGRQAACQSNLKQIGEAFLLYVQDYDGVLPDRRDLKVAPNMPDGYQPWGTTAWPDKSDPRGGWASLLLDPYTKPGTIWSCPSVAGSAMGDLPQVLQQAPGGRPESRYWLWRFDKTTNPVEQDNFWGKTEQEAVDDLRAAALADPKVAATLNPSIPNGVSDTEIVVDPYFPRTIPKVPDNLKGMSVHMGGRDRLFLDGHVKWLRDSRTG